MKRRWGWFGPLAGVILLYGLFRGVPADWYMPRHYSVTVRQFCVSGEVIGVLFSQEKYVHDYNHRDGIIGLGNDGPRRISSEQDVLAIFSISESLRVTHMRQTVSAVDETVWRIVSLTKNVSFLQARFDDDVWQIGDFVKKGIRYTEIKESRGRKMDVAAPGVVSISDMTNAHNLYVRGLGIAGEDEWKPVSNFKWGGRGHRGHRCYVPTTVFEEDYCFLDEKKVPLRPEIILYTLGEDSCVVTNSYHTPLSNILYTTAMDIPTNPLFASCVIWGGPYERPKTKYVIWNPSGPVREISVPNGEYPEEEVALHVATDGRKYIVTLWAKKARRRSVDFRFTFVDLASGEQIVRDVTVPLPPDGR